MERAQVFETVKKYILDQLSVSPDRVTESAAMVDDLGADSANLKKWRSCAISSAIASKMQICW